MADKANQVNIRLNQDEYDTVQALVFLDNTSASEVLRDVVAGYLKAQRSDTAVNQALEALKIRRAQQEGKLTQLRDSARRSSRAEG